MTRRQRTWVVVGSIAGLLAVGGIAYAMSEEKKPTPPPPPSPTPRYPGIPPPKAPSPPPEPR